MHVPGDVGNKAEACSSRRFLFKVYVTAALGTALVLLFFVISFSAHADTTAPATGDIIPSGTTSTRAAAVTAHIADGGGVDN